MIKVLIFGLGNQGQKYINYFLKNNYEVYGVCKTTKTKKIIENKFNMQVYLNYLDLNLDNFEIIILSLPPDIQGIIGLELLNKGFKNKIIIEIPVSFDNSIVKKLKSFSNVYFFLEEYYTLLSTFLRKIDLNNLSSINIKIFTNKLDYEDLEARKVTFLHINSNFLGLKIDDNKFNYDINFHNREDIFYEISFSYNGNNIFYKFAIEKYLLIGEKKIIDNFNFDIVLKKIILETNNLFLLDY